MLGPTKRRTRGGEQIEQPTEEPVPRPHVLKQEDLTVGTHHPTDLLETTHRIRHRTEHTCCRGSVEGVVVVGQVLHIRQIERHVIGHIQIGGPLTCPLQHALGGIDPGQLDSVGVDVQVASGAHPHLEHPAPGTAQQPAATTTDTAEEVHGSVVQVVYARRAVIAAVRHRLQFVVLPIRRLVATFDIIAVHGSSPLPGRSYCRAGPPVASHFLLQRVAL